MCILSENLIYSIHYENKNGGCLEKLKIDLPDDADTPLLGLPKGFQVDTL